MMRNSEKRFKIFANIVLTICSIAAIFPFWLMISASFTEENSAVRDGYHLIPQVFSLDAYKFILQESTAIYRAYAITIFVTAVGTIVSIMIVTMLAYGLTKKFPGIRVINFLVVFTLLFNGGLVPTYLIYTKYFHIGDSIWALLIPNLLMNGFNVMLARNYFTNSIPASLIESAKLDGASEFTVFRKVVFPLSKPIIATIGLMTALGYWNDWQNGLYYLNDSKYYSIQNVLNAINNNIQFLASASSSSIAVNTSAIPTNTARMAVAVIGILPMLIIYPIFQKYFVKGITVGAVKE